MKATTASDKQNAECFRNSVGTKLTVGLNVKDPEPHPIQPDRTL